MIADDRQPGGSGAGSTVKRVYRSRSKDELKAALQLFIDRKATLHVPVDEEHDADCILADGIYELDQLRADLEAARGENAELKAIGKGFALSDDQFRDRALDVLIRVVGEGDRKIEQSRATEAELRARVERRDVVVGAVRAYVEYCRVTNSIYPSAFATSLDALDAAEQPARAQDGPQQPAEA